jgi:hypothetical protein
LERRSEATYPASAQRSPGQPWQAKVPWLRPNRGGCGRHGHKGRLRAWVRETGKFMSWFLHASVDVSACIRAHWMEGAEARRVKDGPARPIIGPNTRPLNMRDSAPTNRAVLPCKRLSLQEGSVIITPQSINSAFALNHHVSMSRCPGLHLLCHTAFIAGESD